MAWSFVDGVFDGRPESPARGPPGSASPVTCVFCLNYVVLYLYSADWRRKRRSFVRVTLELEQKAVRIEVLFSPYGRTNRTAQS